MRGLRNITLCSVLSAITIAGCRHDPDDLPEIPPGVVSYQTDIVPILVTYCYGTGGQLCHVTNTNQGSDGDYTTYEGLKEKVDEGSLQARLFNPDGGMPPDYSNSPQELTDQDMAKFMQWVEDGAPDN